MNGYLCNYRGKQIEVHAETTLAAQVAAAKQFRAKKQWEVSVYLAEKGGVAVLHAPQEFLP